MALIDKAAKFETEDTGAEGVETTTQVMTPAERVAAAAAKEALAQATKPAEATNTAVAVSKPTGGALANKPAQVINPLEALKDRIPVAYGSVKAIMVTNGNVALKDGKELLGPYVGLEILSWQDQWVCSPGGESNDEESLQYLKFSDDGKIERESGEPLANFVQLAIDAGYEKAKIVHRTILVGGLVYPGKDKKGNLMTELENEVVMIDLAPLSRANFLGYQASAAYKVNKGLITAEQATVVKLSAKVKSKGSNNWTDADFATYNPETDYVK